MPLQGPLQYPLDGGTLVVPPSLQFRIKNKHQRCEAIKIIITEIGDIPTDVAMSLDAIDLECGIRPDGFKGLGPGKTVG
jgi:hypothetical protein